MLSEWALNNTEYDDASLVKRYCHYHSAQPLLSDNATDAMLQNHTLTRCKWRRDARVAGSIPD